LFNEEGFWNKQEQNNLSQKESGCFFALFTMLLTSDSVLELAGSMRDSRPRARFGWELARFDG